MFVIQVAATIVLSTLMEVSFRGRDFVLVRLNLRWWAEILVVCKETNTSGSKRCTQAELQIPDLGR